jgi:deoxyribodipyrimidine photo-lyase
MGLSVVWFKRDLRVHDHAPLAQAAAAGPVMALYIVEPELWAQPEMSGRHWAFTSECVEELGAALTQRGLALTIRVGGAVDVLGALHRETGFDTLLSHEETGLFWTYDRDRAVKRWAKRAGVAWIEHPQSGVIRALKSRDGWAKRWDAFMARPRVAAPERLTGPAPAPADLPDAAALRLAPAPCPGRERGGRTQARDLLRAFLASRATRYRRGMSSPLTAPDVCSRLSTHLALGTVSMREVAQAAGAALAQARTAGEAQRAAGIDSFIARLHWRSHFMQKLEDEPELERRALHPACRDLHAPLAPDDPLHAAWRQGRTGFPFIDACMRALIAEGWITFRMRAMLTAFASYHLWREWRGTAAHLARQFTDFEPGIHYPQIQMQSGVTGVNLPRIYNPVKQSRDQDPDGVFIARWCPELAGLAPEHRHEPWAAPGDTLAAAGVEPGVSYPRPIIDHVEAARSARAAIWAVRGDGAFGVAADRVQQRHGSRKAGIRNRGQRPARSRRTGPEPLQPALFTDF